MRTEEIKHGLDHFVSPRELAKSLNLSVERLGRIIRERKLRQPIEMFSSKSRFWYLSTALSIYRVIRNG